MRSRLHREHPLMVRAVGMKPIGTSHTVLSRDGTRIGYLSVGSGPSVLVVSGVLSMAADYAAFARALAEHFTVHTIERRGRGESGPQGDDYSIVKECEDVVALQAETSAALLVGHSYGGLIALEVARNNKAFRKIAVYEPGVSIDGSMPTAWMPGYAKKIAEKRNVDALVEFTLADAPPRIQKTPRWLMKLLLLVLVSCSRQYRQMLNLLDQNLREWQEIARLDSSYEHYREVGAGVLLMYGGKSDSKAVSLAMERLAAILPLSETKEFPILDHFGIERTAPREVAKAVSDYFRSEGRPHEASDGRRHLPRLAGAGPCSWSCTPARSAARSGSAAESSFNSGAWTMYAPPQPNQGVPALKRFEFMSPTWIAMAREQILRALDGKDLRTIRFTLCEEFTNPPEHLRPSGAKSIGFYVRVRDGQVEVGDRPINDADCTIISDYTDALSVARDPEAAAADPAVMAERMAAGRLKIIGDPSAAPAVLAELNIHRLLAPHTA